MSTTAEQVHKRVGQARAISAALNNEQVTRQRVSMLEAESKEHMRMLHFCQVEHRDFVKRGFFGRLRWLITGR